MIRNNRPLVQGIITAFLFLECSGDNEVDPDSAVRCMENMAADLLQLEESDQLALREELEMIASSEEERSSYRDFVRQLPDWIGLAGGQEN